MAEPKLSIATEGHVAILTVARPEKLNAFDVAMLEELATACDRLEADPAVRAVVLTGQGKAFSAGGDINAWSGLAPNAFGHAWVRFGHRVFDRLAGLRMPVIAALNGPALGGGLELAAAADIRIGEAGLRIGLPETSLGMVPGWSGTQRLTRRFGAQIVRRMVLGGEIFDGTEALRHGLIDQLVETGQATGAAKAYAARVAARGPAAVETAKLMLGIAAGEDQGAAVEALGSILVAQTGDLAEGVAAFREKRPARFTGAW